MGESSISSTETTDVKSMTNQTVPICGEHQVPKEWKATTFVYDNDGVSIEVPNVYALMAKPHLLLTQQMN